jgi:hypothetical protein
VYGDDFAMNTDDYWWIDRVYHRIDTGGGPADSPTLGNDLLSETERSNRDLEFGNLKSSVYLQEDAADVESAMDCINGGCFRYFAKLLERLSWWLLWDQRQRFIFQSEHSIRHHTTQSLTRRICGTLQISQGRKLINCLHTALFGMCGDLRPLPYTPSCSCN